MGNTTAKISKEVISTKVRLEECGLVFGKGSKHGNSVSQSSNDGV